MKINCLKSELTGAVAIVSKAIAGKPQTPILSGIYLKAENGQLELQATNYEIGFISRIPAEIEEEGQVVVSGRYFQEMIRKLPADRIILTVNNDENTVHIQSGPANFTLLRMNPAEFPVIHRLEGTLSFTTKDNILRTLIRKTVFACSKDESRPVFTGCSLQFDHTKLTIAATNTHRLAVRTETFDTEIGQINVIVPGKFLNDLLHYMTSEIPTDVTVTCSLNQISFEFDNLYLTSRLIEGSFPNYQRVIPQNLPTSAVVDTQAFASAVDRVSLISRSGEYNIIRLQFADNQIHISSNNPEVGNAEESVQASIEGPELNIAFNALYINDALHVIESKQCRIGLDRPLSPVLIRDDGDPTFLYVATPVRTQN